MKTRYDAKLMLRFTFEEGDLVLYFSPRRYTLCIPTLYTKWQNMNVGPYVVKKVLDPCNIAKRTPLLDHRRSSGQATAMDGPET